MTAEASDEILQEQHCGGRDLISNPLLTSPDGKLIFVRDYNKVTVFNADTGQPVRELNTGASLGIALDKDKPNELIVALPSELVTWDHDLAKVVSTHKYIDRELMKSIQEVIIPSNFAETKEFFGLANSKRNVAKLVRVNIKNHTCESLISDVLPGSFHVGHQNNCVVVIVQRQYANNNIAMSSLQCYDISLTNILTFNASRTRPLTIVRCHPTEKIIACGDSLGRILIVQDSGINGVLTQMEIRHWHSYGVRALAWSPEGSHIYSGGYEAVLCKWYVEERSRPSFTPRIGSEIIGIQICGPGSVAVQLENNSVKIVGPQGQVLQELFGLSRNPKGWPAGLLWNKRSKSLHLNGNIGYIQVFYPETNDTRSLDVARQNYLSKEASRDILNSEVEVMAMTEDGMFMVTVDACWTQIPRILMKFWHFRQSTQEFVLHTQIDSPHKKGVRELHFKPDNENSEVSIISVGCDKACKLWVLQDGEEGDSFWSCQYAFQFRNLECNTAAWSSDGSVLVIAFQHIAAIFNKACQLKTTLTVLDDKPVTINNLTFGQGLKQSVFLCATTSTMLCVWNLITLERKTTNLSFSSNDLISDPRTGNLVVIAKEELKFLRFDDFSTVAKFDGSFNGAAVFGMYKSTPVLYYMTSTGKLRMIGYKLFTEEFNTMSIKKVNHFLAARRSAFVPKEIEAESRKKTSDDINSLLAVPLHAVPNNASLVVSFLSNRVRGLPKTRIAGTIEQLERIEAQPTVNLAAKCERYRHMFGFSESNQQPADLNEFAKNLELIRKK